MIVVRYADDTIIGFEHRHEEEQFLADLKARLACFWTEPSSRQDAAHRVLARGSSARRGKKTIKILVMDGKGRRYYSRNTPHYGSDLPRFAQGVAARRLVPKIGHAAAQVAWMGKLRRGAFSGEIQ
jgi:hypothetical protein